MNRKLSGLMLVVLTLSILLTACGQTEVEVTRVVTEKQTIVEKETITETVIVAGTPEVREVEVTKEVIKEVEVVVTATPEPSEPVFLRYADKAADLGTMDPHFAAATNDRNLVDMIFNGLIRYKPGDGSVFEPDLAEALPEPEVVDGKQVWIFNLRRGVMCHPSDEVPSYELTAEDVVFSLQKSATRTPPLMLASTVA